MAQNHFMPKAKDLRLTGIKFEDAIKRMIATPPPKTSTKKPSSKPRRK